MPDVPADTPDQRPGLDPAAGDALASLLAGDHGHPGLHVTGARFIYEHVEPRRGRRWRIAGTTRRDAPGSPLVIAELTVALPEGEPLRSGVDTQVLRSLPLGRLLTWLETAEVRGDQRTRTAYTAVMGREPQWPAPPGPRRRGRPPRREEYMARLAQAYLTDQGGPGLYERLGAAFPDDQGRPTPAATITSHIHLARRQGWLGPTGRGRRPTRDPGPRLVEWLQDTTRKDDDDV